MNLKKILISCALGSLLATGVTTTFAQDKGLANPRSEAFWSAMKDKRVIFIPLAMGFDLTEGWAAVMKQQAKRLGYKFDIRDPNWSTEAGTRALAAAIAEKPDVLVLHNPDVQSYAKLIKQAQDAGIKVIQVNLESSVATDSYVGADWTEIGETAARAVVERCAKGKGISTKVAIDTGVPTAASDIFQVYGIYKVFSQYPEIQVVSQQATEYNADKARSIMETVLKQNPDLCGSIGIWDNQDVGTGSAIAQAGKQKQVFMVTSGGGNKTGCDNVSKGLFNLLISYNVPLQGQGLNLEIARLLQSKAKAGAEKIPYFTPLTQITAKEVNSRNCWTLDDLK